MDNMFWLIVVYILLSALLLGIAVWVFRVIVRNIAGVRVQRLLEPTCTGEARILKSMPESCIVYR